MSLPPRHTLHPEIQSESPSSASAETIDASPEDSGSGGEEHASNLLSEQSVSPGNPLPAEEESDSAADAEPSLQEAYGRVRALQGAHFRAWYRVQRAEAALEAAEREMQNQARAVELAWQTVLRIRAQQPTGRERPGTRGVMEPGSPAAATFWAAMAMASRGSRGEDRQRSRR